MPGGGHVAMKWLEKTEHAAIPIYHFPNWLIFFIILNLNPEKRDFNF